MPDTLVGIVEKYFTAFRDVHGLGAGTPELSYYPALVNLLNDVGKELKPKVFCLSILERSQAFSRRSLSAMILVTLAGNGPLLTDALSSLVGNVRLPTVCSIRSRQRSTFSPASSGMASSKG